MEYTCTKLFIIFINYLSREKIFSPGKVLSNKGWKTHLENVANLGWIRIFREVDILHASRVLESIILYASGDRIPPHVQENNRSIVRKQETAKRSFHTLKASSHSDEIKIHRHSHKCLKYHQLTIAVLYLSVILASVKFHFSATSYFKHYGACLLSGNCHFHFMAWFPVSGKKFLFTRNVTI